MQTQILGQRNLGALRPQQAPRSKAALYHGRRAAIIRAAHVGVAPPATGVIADKKAELAINGKWDS